METGIISFIIQAIPALVIFMTLCGGLLCLLLAALRRIVIDWRAHIDWFAWRVDVRIYWNKYRLLRFQRGLTWQGMISRWMARQESVRMSPLQNNTAGRLPVLQLLTRLPEYASRHFVKSSLAISLPDPSLYRTKWIETMLHSTFGVVCAHFHVLADWQIRCGPQIPRTVWNIHGILTLRPWQTVRAIIRLGKFGIRNWIEGAKTNE